MQTRTAGRFAQRTRSKSKPKASSGGGAAGRLGGVALVTAAAGLAFRNRDKLMGLVKRRRSEESEAEVQPYVAPTPTPAVPPAEPPAGVDTPPRTPPL